MGPELGHWYEGRECNWEAHYLTKHACTLAPGRHLWGWWSSYIFGCKYFESQLINFLPSTRKKKKKTRGAALPRHPWHDHRWPMFISILMTCWVHEHYNLSQLRSWNHMYKHRHQDNLLASVKKEIKSNKAVAIFIVAAKWKNAMRLPVSKLIVYVFWYIS